jgi:hypothetical protein
MDRKRIIAPVYHFTLFKKPRNYSEVVGQDATFEYLTRDSGRGQFWIEEENRRMQRHEEVDYLFRLHYHKDVVAGYTTNMLNPLDACALCCEDLSAHEFIVEYMLTPDGNEDIYSRRACPNLYIRYYYNKYTNYVLSEELLTYAEAHGSANKTQ